MASEREADQQLADLMTSRNTLALVSQTLSGPVYTPCDLRDRDRERYLNILLHTVI